MTEFRSYFAENVLFLHKEMIEEVEVVEILGNNDQVILEFTTLKAGRTKGNQVSVSRHFKRAD